MPEDSSVGKRVAEMLDVFVQDDTELDDQVRLLSGPEGSIRVVQLQPNQLSLKLWEPLCADNPNPGEPPLLLMPPEYEWLDPENGPRELAEIMYIGQRVSAASTMFDWLIVLPWSAWISCLSGARPWVSTAEYESSNPKNGPRKLAEIMYIGGRMSVVAYPIKRLRSPCIYECFPIALPAFGEIDHLLSRAQPQIL